MLDRTSKIEFSAINASEEVDDSKNIVWQIAGTCVAEAFLVELKGWR